ncbi:hypothetical protein [Sphingomonas sp.]|uniref:hypothetical protein n=1 Tax=Sphingomonas sp. TaxID=28214 RepID=UPI002DD635A0|nr:hypothetical protein [Sphingomonas sp.]
MNDAEVDALIAVGHDVLLAFPSAPGACVMMSALYVGRLHSLGYRSASLVGGMLAIDGAAVFGHSRVTDDFSRTNLDWGGHAWITFGEYLADVSLVTTAYSSKAPRRLADRVRNLRKPNQRLYIATPEAASTHDGLTFTPQIQFTDDELTALYRGALTFLS